MRYFPDVQIGSKYAANLDGTNVCLEIIEIKFIGMGQSLHPSISVNVTVDGASSRQGLCLSNLEAWFTHGEWTDFSQTEGC